MKLLAIHVVTCACLITNTARAAESIGTKSNATGVAALDSPTSYEKPFTFTAYWENDGTILKPNNNNDRHYTNGVAFTFSHRPEWVEGFADFVTLGESFDKTAAGYIVGQLMFTPDDLDARVLIPDDRPYAGYLFAGAYLQRANDNVFDHAQLDLGMIGPSSQAGYMQHDFHRWFGEDEPRGWSNQLPDEFTVQLKLRRKWRFDLEPFTAWDHEFDQQLIPQVDLAVGTVYRNVSAGATWRVGLHMPDDFGPGRLADVSSATGNQSNKTGGYAFVRATGKAVQYDIFLDGSEFRDSHGVDSEPLVGEIQIGIALYGKYKDWLLQANYSQTFMSKDFEDQGSTDSYGALMLSASSSF